MKRVLLLFFLLSACYPAKNIVNSKFTYNKDLGGREGVFSYRFILEFSKFNIGTIDKIEINGFELTDVSSFSKNGKIYIEGVVYPSDSDKSLYKDLNKQRIELPIIIFTQSKVFKLSPHIVKKSNRPLL
jgi:hypothetical protein